MKIAVIGGGPGGLYFSILTKKAMPGCHIEVFERNRADDSFGFGVVFSDETLSEFLTRDPESYELIRSRFAYWDELAIARDGEEVRITGNGFCGCSRKTLLQLLQQRCREVGVQLHFEKEVSDLSISKEYDIVVACDGIGSNIRTQLATTLGTTIDLKKNRFVWMGSTKPLDAFTYFFRNTVHGPMVAHTYQYEEGMSTWIFECSPDTWEKFGFCVDDEADTMRKLSEIYKDELAGHALINNKSHWRQFPEVRNQNWHAGNIVLLGDAKATAHFSIGSGTKLAMECAIALSDAVVANPGNHEAAFSGYEKARRNRVETIQHAANVSLDWFEHMDRHMQHPLYQFAFGVMTRAKKVTYENLRLRDKSFTDKVLAEFNARSGNTDQSRPAAFNPYSLRGMKLNNRIVMSPMGQYSAREGLVSDWHLVHYGSRAQAGVGLIIAELTAICPTGRITESCAGIYTSEHIAGWKKITDFIHHHTTSVIGIQLGHSGRKGAVKVPWEGPGQPIDNPWELISASPVAFSDKLAVPREISTDDMHVLEEQFVQAARNADAAGFDMVELQAHHGFLLGSFLSPLTNQRTDEFGGNIDNRLKFPLKVFKAMRAVFPQNKPMSVRISAEDWAENGITEAEVLRVAGAFKNAGADIINVSTGLTVSHQQPQVGRMWQTPFSDAVRNSAGVPTITTGYIQDIDQVNTILLNGRADLVALGRPLLIDPGFVRHAQAYEQFEADDIPMQYLGGRSHLYPLKAAERKAMESMKKALKPDSHKKAGK
jgi:anthraniloyl-CoA monooxygenase